MLSSDGLCIHVGSSDIIVKGGLVAFTGDTLAANVIGGFKEGVGFAHKICRTCEATKEQSPRLLCHDDCILREINEHIRRCECLQSSLTDKAKKYWSRVYGINKRSVLLDVTSSVT